MHELGIAESIMETARVEAERNGGGRILRIGLRIGALAAVDEESLRFCFEALAQGTAFAGTELNIENSPGSELDFKYLELEDGDGTGCGGAEGPQ